MAKVILLLADGFEELEAVAIADIVRRADIELVIAGVGPGAKRGAHQIVIEPDAPFETLDPAQFDALVLPGGTPGSRRLRENPRVLELIRQFDGAGKTVAAICAAPSALEAAGILAGRRATSFPGVELPSAEYAEERVVADGNVLTSRGPGTAVEFALALVARLGRADRVDQLRQQMII